MTQTQLLHEFGQLAMPQQLEFLQNVLRLMPQSAPVAKVYLAGVPAKTSLSDAAQLLLDDYANDEELTSFTSGDAAIKVPLRVMIVGVSEG